jgi:hypothetical protein
VKFFSFITICAAGLLLLVFGSGLLISSHSDKKPSVLQESGPVQPNQNLPGELERETLAGRKQSAGNYSWPYGYDIALKNQAIQITVAINFVPVAGINMPYLNQVKQTWESGIESTWSNRFAVTLPSGRHLPILVDAIFRGPNFHHDIIVRSGKAGSDVLNWNITDTPAIAAHEFGHLLGVFDEYEGGALSPETNLIDTTSIMTSNPRKGQVYARHYLDILDWFKTRTHNPNVTLSVIKKNNLTTISKTKEDRI